CARDSSGPYFDYW
nr:immunoglobulin heavy chain junction region [Mus musculus]NSM06747.1 immunoglobulin heavy chain junction region [Mus musculus]NSM06873.1 immunoglobulin heavy chain junction region [Mus musculus]NSM07536.1 immunoglobulin heavy chain junction region [Mus musculus]NSM08834.1 immunoglobulin heavy chain junction region [Mus musculus]